MMKLKSFLVGTLLLIIVFIMVVLATLIYRAHEQSEIRTYFFQMGNNANERVGELQNIDNISQNDLRNKLIEKYVSEYFKVIPGDTDVSNRPILKRLSKGDVFEKWQNGVAKSIAEMSKRKTFRMAKVTGIQNYTDEQSENKGTYYEVRYNTYTWIQPNNMNTEPIVDSGVIYIEILFEPKLREHDIDGEKLNIKKYLESGRNPIGLFRFKVTATGSKDVR